ncbi:hypothetical protein ACT7C2_21675 [Bacillus pacificus]
MEDFIKKNTEINMDKEISDAVKIGKGLYINSFLEVLPSILNIKLVIMLILQKGVTSWQARRRGKKVVFQL